MNLQLVNALIDSSTRAFDAMLSLHVDSMAPVSRAPIACDKSGVTAIVGLSGDLTGSITFSAPIDCARRLTSVFTGSDVSGNADEMCDVVGEIISMIADGAMAQAEAPMADCSCPTVIIGDHYAVTGNASDERFVIPFSCECGEFWISVSICREQVESSSSSCSGVLGASERGTTR